MREPTVPAQLSKRVPYLEPAAGAAWWTVGCAALGGGSGTVVLAAGLGLTAAMTVALRRRFGAGAPLPRGATGRLLRLFGITVALVAVAATALAYFGFGELAVPVACAIVGVALLPVSSVLDERALVAAGAVLMVLGAAGALLALGSAGLLYPQGVVGLVAGAVLWTVGAYRTGMLADLRGGIRR
ncbi:MAG: hypothetical protein LH603_14015 [Pseudonocardia sp.]|nr:hypothetical protein [Pseudonocardia sp.]